MISFERICIEVHEVSPAELHHWIAEDLIRPRGTPDAYQFDDIDVARIRLIKTLRDELEISETALPTVLSLLDQLYEMRRHMRSLNAALENTVPADIRATLLKYIEDSHQ
ncbi:MAG: hypothetical protein B7Z75_01900 [Acidocella sp. 20-57-95]|nr:MAG: hypothetical protein B7Z75_01900 [Acidocella sp. 20-57-95]OYV62208.1 MAG: hypothetical protein B7Z71_02085 [Acidocella sp. 21-58-7]HQT63754.1 chaperone modulator CbpM [Acidocella sp.]HQU03130.1 chaperone modulator CbpM [Acidocella sp.]